MCPTDFLASHKQVPVHKKQVRKDKEQEVQVQVQVHVSDVHVPHPSVPMGMDDSSVSGFVRPASVPMNVDGCLAIHVRTVRVIMIKHGRMVDQFSFSSFAETTCTLLSHLIAPNFAEVTVTGGP